MDKQRARHMHMQDRVRQHAHQHSLTPSEYKMIFFCVDMTQNDHEEQKTS